ncbi:MAG: pyridoxamine 5'-phosphate oxidase [Alphaproteobacteria bacterium]|nr:pyridoxamine 5'-phosphate oxidase [Alphaproteobacteria bacterium]
MSDIFANPPAAPLALFGVWLGEARTAEPNDAEAMALATYNPDDMLPNIRMVLLKTYDERGFTFHTNLESQKGLEIAAHPYGAACFHWKSLRRQVRLRGRMESVDAAEADAYFATRSRQSRVGAWASQQSRPLTHYSDLQTAATTHTQNFEGEEVPRPPYWGGCRLVVSEVEFWQDGAHRLHHRLVYKRTDNNEWQTHLLYP